MVEEAKIIYYIDEEKTPYLIKVQVPLEKVTLGDLKNALQSKTCYKYYFKSVDDSFGFVKEEITDDNTILPHSKGRIVCWLATIEGSHHSSEQSAARPGRGMYVPPPSAIPLTDSNLQQRNADGSNPNNATYLYDAVGQRAHSNSHSSTSNTNLNVPMSARRSISQSGSGTGTEPHMTRLTADGERDSADGDGDALSADGGAHDDQVAPLPQIGARYARHPPAVFSGGAPLGGHSHLQLTAQPLGVPIGVPPGYDTARNTGSSMFSSDLDSTSFCDSADDSSRISSATGTMSWIQRRGHKRLRRRRVPPISRASSFSSTTDSTMSLNIVTVTLNLDTCNFLGISIVGQSNAQGDGGIYVGSIMKGGAVDQDGHIEPGDMILEVNGVSFECMSNDDAVRVLREAVSKPGPITLVVAKCWDAGPQRAKGYFTVPKQEPARPIDPRAWVMHTQAHAVPPPSCELSMLQGSPVVPPPSTFSHNAPSTHIDSVSQIDYQRILAASQSQRAATFGQQMGDNFIAAYAPGMGYPAHAAGYPMYSAGVSGHTLQPTNLTSLAMHPAGQLCRPSPLRYPPSSTVLDSESSYTAEADAHVTVDSDPLTILRLLALPESGLEVRDRNWLKITIRNAFIGADLVDQLHTRIDGFNDRRSAKRYACQLLKQGLIKHTVNKSSFSEQCYYTFSEQVLAAASGSQPQSQPGSAGAPANPNDMRETNLDDFESVSSAGQQRGNKVQAHRSWPVSATQYAANASRFANPYAYQQYAARVPFGQPGAAQAPNMYATDASSQLTLPAPSLAFSGNEIQAQADQRPAHNRLSGSFRPPDAAAPAQQPGAVSVQFAPAPTANTFQPPLSYDEKQQRSLVNTSGATSVLSGGTSVAVENCACLHTTLKQFRSLLTDKEHSSRHRKKHSSKERDPRQANAGAHTPAVVQQNTVTAQRQLRSDALKVQQPAGMPAQPVYAAQQYTAANVGSTGIGVTTSGGRGPPQYQYVPQPLFRPAAAGFSAPADGQQLSIMSRIFSGPQTQVATTQLSFGAPPGGPMIGVPNGVPNPRTLGDAANPNMNNVQLEGGREMASSTSTSGSESDTDEAPAEEAAAITRRGIEPPTTSRTHSNNETGSATNSHAEQISLNGTHNMMAMLGSQCERASLGSNNSNGLSARLNMNGHGMPIAAQAQI